MNIKTKRFASVTLHVKVPKRHADAVYGALHWLVDSPGQNLRDGMTMPVGSLIGVDRGGWPKPVCAFMDAVLEHADGVDQILFHL